MHRQQLGFAAAWGLGCWASPLHIFGHSLLVQGLHLPPALYSGVSGVLRLRGIFPSQIPFTGGNDLASLQYWRGGSSASLPPIPLGVFCAGIGSSWLLPLAMLLLVMLLLQGNIPSYLLQLKLLFLWRLRLPFQTSYRRSWVCLVLCTIPRLGGSRRQRGTRHHHSISLPLLLQASRTGQWA